MRVLAISHGHLGQAADLLGIHRNTLRRKLQEYGVAEHDGADVGVGGLDPLRRVVDGKPEGHTAGSGAGPHGARRNGASPNGSTSDLRAYMPRVIGPRTRPSVPTLT
jgi:hypothetical protein